MEMGIRVIIKDRKTGRERLFKTTDHDRIYEHVTRLGGDHEEAAEIESWAELAEVGEEMSLPHAIATIVDTERGRDDWW